MKDDEFEEFELVRSPVLGDESGVGHFVNTYKKCPKCGGVHFEVRDYDMMWHDGEVWCVDCNVYVRGYDAG